VRVPAGLPPRSRPDRAVPVIARRFRPSLPGVIDLRRVGHTGPGPAAQQLSNRSHP